MGFRTRRGGIPARRFARGVLVVARDEVALYQSFNRAFGGPGGIAVLLDRRQTERRQTVQFVPQDRRRTERRRALSIETDLRHRRYVLVRLRRRRPRD